MTVLKRLTASIAVLALVACESPEEKAAKFAANAQEYLEEGELQRARLQFANALQNDPDNVAALRGAAEVAELRERYGEQMRYLSRIVELVPDDMDASAELARLQLLSGDIDSAMERADDVLANEPENVQALTVKGASLVLENDLDGATEVLDQALALDPANAEVRNLLAARFVRDENFSEARRIIEEGLEADPAAEELLAVKLILAQRQQDLDEMDETFQRLIEVNAENGLYRERYGEFLLRGRQDLDGALEQYRSALPLVEDKTDLVSRQIGVVRAVDGDDAAEAELRQIVADYPDAELDFAIADFLCQVGKTEDCVAELERLTGEEIEDIAIRNEAMVRLGERRFTERDLEGAMARADEALALDASNPNALTLKGKVQLASEEVEPAIETLREAVSGDPDKESALILLGLAYEADGRASFGQAQLAQAIDRLGLTPTLYQAYRGMLMRAEQTDDVADLTLRYAQGEFATPEVRRESAALLINDGRTEEAEGILRSLVRTDPADDEARQLLIANLLQQTRTEDALEQIDLLSEEGQRSTNALRLKSEALGRMERFDEVRSYLNEEAAAGENEAAYALLTQFELNQGENDRALAAADDGVTAFPGNEGLHLARYNALLASGDRDDAKAALLKGIDEADSTINLRTLQSNELMQDGRREEALEVLTGLYEENSLSDLTANNFASLTLDLGDDPAAALEVAQRFEGTQQPFFADTLAWAYYNNGDVEKAAEYATIAAEAEVNNAEIHYHRGVIEAAQGNVNAAREAFTQALEAPGKTDSVSDEVIQAALEAL
ncbi:MAG: tetratricopeptide repeat protein [Pseudomonadota bacterium]